MVESVVFLFVETHIHKKKFIKTSVAIVLDNS